MPSSTARSRAVSWSSGNAVLADAAIGAFRKARISPANCVHARSSASGMWFSLSSVTKRASGMRLVSRRPSSIGTTASRSG
ncbi:MAG: hypothetical protein WBL48_06800 [Pseudolabrys sp.]